MISPQVAVQHAAKVLGGVFLTSRVVQGLGQLSASLPDVAAGHILECRLDGPAGAADYSMAVMRNGGQFDSLLKHAPSDATRALLAAADHGLSEAGVIWLEFDVTEDGRAGNPSFFVASNLRPTPHLNAAALTRGMSLALTGREIDVSSVLAKLPEGVYLRQSGMMAGRPGGSETVRLVLDGVKVEEVPALLDLVEWPGDLAKADALAANFAKNAPHAICKVDLDFSDALEPDLGLELPGEAIAAAPGLVDSLIDNGLASREKGRALRDLAERRGIGHIDGPSGSLVLNFGLNHVKLTCATAKKPQNLAKAYFSFVAIPELRPEKGSFSQSPTNE